MKRMLEEVVLKGTGKKAILDGYTSAGKTGTAQKINPFTHRYDRVKHIASFSDRKSTRLNSSHSQISYAVFCLKKKQRRRSRRRYIQRKRSLDDQNFHLS